MPYVYVTVKSLVLGHDFELSAVAASFVSIDNWFQILGEATEKAADLNASEVCGAIS
jgi:hypothetical protein